ncbi:MAG: response regulator [Actinomycetota bacterium]|nr:response regulator [Actinomycetota bacterium]
MANILIVDDEPSLRLMISMVLQAEGHNVHEADNGRQALALVADCVPDVILLDLMMPEMDGWRFLEELRACGLRSRTRVVIISALSDDESIQRSRDEGARSHLVKPFDLTALVDAVNDALSDPPEELLSKTERVSELASLLRTLDVIDEDD